MASFRLRSDFNSRSKSNSKGRRRCGAKDIAPKQPFPPQFHMSQKVDARSERSGRAKIHPHCMNPRLPRAIASFSPTLISIDFATSIFLMACTDDVNWLRDANLGRRIWPGGTRSVKYPRHPRSSPMSAPALTFPAHLHINIKIERSTGFQFFFLEYLR